MQALRGVIQDCKAQGKAVGHFNFSDSNQLKAIAEAAREAGLPVIAGLSEGEREYFSIAQARALIDLYQAQGVQIYLNADHTYTLQKAQEAIDAGVDSVVVDGAKLPMEENIALTKSVAAYARGKRGLLRGGRDVVVEGELGYIGQASKQLDSLPEGVAEANLTTPEDAKKFVQATGVACLAPAVGNVHGMLKNAAEPRLHAGRVKAIAGVAGVPLVLHGASGNTVEDIRACIKAGMAVVHINTELRLLYRDSLRASLLGEETTPYKFLTPAVQAMQAFVADKLRAFAA